MQLKNIDSQQKYLFVGILLLLCVDLATYITVLPVAVISVCVYLSAFFCLSKYKVGYPDGTHKPYIWTMINIYVVMLCCRLIVDFVIPGKGFFLYKSPATLMFFFFCLIAIPIFYFQRRAFTLDTKRLCYVFGIVLAICLAISFNDIVSGRIRAASDGRFEGSNSIDVILYGHYGVTAIIIALSLLRAKTYRAKYRIVGICCLLMGISAVVFAGSRGPFMALVVCLIVYILAPRKNVLISILIGVCCYLSIDFLMQSLDSFNETLNNWGFHSFDRVIDSFSKSGSEASSGRDKIFLRGWNQFLEHPIFGVSLLFKDGSYVHNIIIEQFMALGMVGGLLFLSINVIVFYYAFKVIKHQPQNAVIPLLYIQYFVFGCFSRTIIALPEFWLCLALTIKMYENQKARTQNLTLEQYSK
jgi:hypothetical protein